MGDIPFTLLNALRYIDSADQDYSNTRLIEAWQTVIDSEMFLELKDYYVRTAALLIGEGLCIQKKQNKDKDPDYCDACGCTPCDCGFGSY